MGKLNKDLGALSFRIALLTKRGSKDGHGLNIAANFRTLPPLPRPRKRTGGARRYCLTDISAFQFQGSRSSRRVAG